MEFSGALNFSSTDDFEGPEESRPSKYLEDELNTSDDSSNLSTKLIHDKNKICPLCNHIYTTEEDFVAHSALHFSRPGSTTSNSSNSLPNSPNSVDIGLQFYEFPAATATSTAVVPQNHHRAPPPPYGSHLLGAPGHNFWAPGYQPQGSFNGNPNHHTTFEVPHPFHNLGYTSHHQQVSHHQSLTCQKCGLYFSNYQHFVQHSNVCAFQYPLVNPHQTLPAGAHILSRAQPGGVLTKGKSSHGKKCHSNCDCSGKAKQNHSSGLAKTISSRKRKQQVEKENIDLETLAKYRALEWEQKTGYWCQRCNLRFPTSDLLVDHMAKNVHKPKATADNVNETPSLKGGE